jgi:lipopolysaccharide export LptBFGC system permease protein LptF
MWKLHRYYLKEVLINAAITFLVLFAVMLVSVVYRAIGLAQGGGPFDALLIALFLALDAFPHVLTISFLIAVVLAYTRAAQDRELVAIRAAGISPWSPMTAAILAGVALTVVASFALHYVMPEVHFRAYRVISPVVRNAVLSMGLRSDRIRFREFVMTSRERDRDRYQDCVLYSGKPLLDFASTILFVDDIAIPIGQDDNASIVLTGIRDPFGGNQAGELRLECRPDALSSREGRLDRDDDLRSDQLLAEVMRGMHRRPHEAIYELLRRCCFALMPLLLAPIGYCLAELARERGRVFALVMALVPLSLFYLGELLGSRFLLQTRQPLCAFMPCALLLAFGVPLCWRQLRR